MRLFWKQFLFVVGLVIGSFIFFGCILINNSFHKSLDREKEQALQTIQMYQYSMLASLNIMIKDNQSVDIAASDIAKTIYMNMRNTGNAVAVYNEKGGSIYNSSNVETNLISKRDKMDNGMLQVEYIDGEHYLVSIVRTEYNKRIFYFEIDSNIGFLYASREELYISYQKILMIIVVISIIAAAFLSNHMVRPIKRLSNATREFANGNYEKRVKKRSNDEVTDLTMAFNSMADKLEESIEQLKEAARRQEEFTGAFAHELKTPLTSIVGYSEALCSMKLTKEEQLSCANYIYHQGKRLESLSYKMQELVGIQNQGWHFEALDVTSLATSVEQITEQVRKIKNITLEIDLEDGRLTGDKILLESLLVNLIDNARKASKENSVILLKGMQLDEGYRLQVIDHGCGIPKKEINKIHELFYMVDKSRARKEGGAGIGMALCEKILELHHGTWEIISIEEEGTTITLFFPEVKSE